MTFPTLTFVSYDGEPFVYVERPDSMRCWSVPEGSSAWVKVDPRIAFRDGKVLSRAVFEKRFDPMPPWPKDFHTPVNAA